MLRQLRGTLWRRPKQLGSATSSLSSTPSSSSTSSSGNNNKDDEEEEASKQKASTLEMERLVRIDKVMYGRENNESG
jgi:hypothetical protein